MPLAVTVLSLGLGAAYAEPMPSELRQLVENRSTSSLAVEFTLRDRFLFQGERTFRAEYRHGDILNVSLGDERGIVMSPDDVGIPFACSPEYTLLAPSCGEYWTYRRDDPHARVSLLSDLPRPELSVVDPRGFGCTARLGTSKHLDKLGYVAFDEDTRYTHYERDELPSGLIQITGHLPDHRIEHRWLLDPARGFNAVRCELWESGRRDQYSETRLSQVDGGDWYPEQVNYYSGGELSESLVILKARIDDPKDSAPLTPAALGLVDGVKILRLPKPDVVAIPQDDGTLRVPVLAIARWGLGHELAESEFQEAIRRGDLSGDGFLKLLEGLQSADGAGRFPPTLAKLTRKGLAGLSRDPALWEEYVRCYVREHRFGVARTRKAWDVLEIAQDLAIPQFDDHRDEISLLRRKVETKPGQGEAGAQKEVARAEEELRSLLSPIARIFEHELQAKLETLDSIRDRE